MRTLPFPAYVLLGTGLLLGVLGDVVLRSSGAPGLNFFVWAAAVCLATVLLHRRSGRLMSGESAAFLAVGVLFAAGPAWRDAEALKLLALVCAAVAFALPALRSGAAWIRTSGVGGYLSALLGAAGHAAFGAVRTAAAVDWTSMPAGERSRRTWGHAAAVMRGVALAAPIVIVFGALLMGADAVFAQIVTDTLRIDVEELLSHVVLTGVLAWIATGYLYGFTSGATATAPFGSARERSVLGITETATVLALLDLLFLVFVIVQFRYLFGGSSLVEVTQGLTYAEYARRGFFELVTVAALVLPLLLVADWLLRRERPRDEIIFRVLTGVQIVLILVVTVSAHTRMRLYQQEYGLTEERLYVTAVLILITAVLLWFAATVLRGRRQSFGFGALLAGFATVAVLYIMNPDAVIARTNLERTQSGTAGVAFDAAYATSLSADAVPVLLAALPTLPAESRCLIAQRTLRRWPLDGAGASLKTWSWSDAKARRAVQANADLLQRLTGEDAGCDTGPGVAPSGAPGSTPPPAGPDAPASRPVLPDP